MTSTAARRRGPARRGARSRLAWVAALLVSGSFWIHSPGSAAPGDNVVLRWNDAALQAVRESRMGPPMVARALAVIHTCIFDA